MVKVLFAGDFAPRHRVKALVDDSRYDRVFGQVRRFTGGADYSVVNLEAPVVVRDAVAIEKTGPNLCCSPGAVEAIRYAGFDAVTLANNHFYDYGESGVRDTLNTLNEQGMDYVGGGRDMNEARRVLYKVIGSTRVAFVNFCESEWSIAGEHAGGAAPLNPVANYYQVKAARGEADRVVVVVHGGHEHYRLPSPRMKETYRFFVDAGADAVVNHHQHCFSGYEVYRGSPIFYGLGNFCFDDPRRRNAPWNEGFMVELVFGEGETSFNLYPYHQCNDVPVVDFMAVDGEGFRGSLAGLNEVIGDDRELESSYGRFVREREGAMFSLLEPYYNRYLKALRARGLLFSLLSRRQRRLLLNLIRCEAHRDVLLKIMDK